ncbi:MAG: YfcC family protein [Bacteroidales bacterium]|nr:YfcC family protein [Bacteroidales bacterium]
MLKKTKVPHTYVIVFSIILLSAILTWIIPAGKYITEKNEVDGKNQNSLTFYYEKDLPAEYQSTIKSEPQTWQVFSALFNGFVRQSSIIAFILIIGGAFWIMNKSKAIDVAILSFLRFVTKLEHNRILRSVGVDNLVIVLVMSLFSLFGSIFGMSEETIAFTIIFIPLAISMGYDSIVGVCMVYIGAHLGFAGAILNPFTIGIAQGLSGIPLFSGIEYRVVCWIIINIVGFAFVLRYAHKVKKNPKSSLMYHEDAHWRKMEVHEDDRISYYTPKAAWYVYLAVLLALSGFSWFYPISSLKFGISTLNLHIIPVLTLVFAVAAYFSLRKSVHYFILLLLAYTVIFLIVGVMAYAWYVMEIASLFLALGVCSGLAINKSSGDISKLFLEGVNDISSAAIVVGLAGGIIVILENGGVIDSILYGLSKSMSDFGGFASVTTIYVIETLTNIIIPSGSAKAALTMPIMAPFSDLVGISRQATVMAYQFGGGFTNMITPTSGVLMGVLGVARIPYQKWFKWSWPLILILFLLGILLLIPTVTMKLNGF